MTRIPDFDELVGADVPPAERERLRRAHELVVAAGPPPELSPALEAGPSLALTLGRPAGARAYRRVLLLAAALAVLALAFLGGYIAGNGGGSTTATSSLLRLAGTRAAPGALASLRIEPVDRAGNWPMRLTVTGLPKLPARGYYEVYVVRDGKPWASCGVFVVDGASSAVTVALNAPYDLRRTDTWVVTKRLPGQPEPGTIVLSPRASA